MEFQHPGDDRYKHLDEWLFLNFVKYVKHKLNKNPSIQIWSGLNVTWLNADVTFLTTELNGYTGSSKNKKIHSIIDSQFVPKLTQIYIDTS